MTAYPGVRPMKPLHLALVASLVLVLPTIPLASATCEFYCPNDGYCVSIYNIIPPQIYLELQNCVPGTYDHSLPVEWHIGTTTAPCGSVASDGHAVIQTARCIQDCSCWSGDYPTSWVQSDGIYLHST